MSVGVRKGLEWHVNDPPRFGNLGPGDIIGLASAESYATAVRGTCYGISAALGKTGAAVGTQAFTPIQTYLGKKWT